MIFLKERLYVIFFTGATHINISLVFIMFASDILTVRSITTLLTRLSTVTVVSYILDEL